VGPASLSQSFKRRKRLTTFAAKCIIERAAPHRNCVVRTNFIRNTTTTTLALSLDLKQIRIRPLQDKDAIRRFSCGVREIDGWCVKALKRCNTNRSRVFCAHIGENASAIGFYSLTFSSESQAKIMDRTERQLWTNGVPLVYLEYIAVLKSSQGLGLGSFMLMNALQRAYEVSKHVAFYGVGLRSLNSRTTEIYQKLGFAIAPEEGEMPLMILPIWSIGDLFGERSRFSQ
jgi:GNAT superfamily N-acetyltransferase